MNERVKVLLIGGSSHVGKSTLARRVAEQLQWRYLSTDQLARHPGRPWRDDGSAVPADVASHYATLSTTELLDDVVGHYHNNVWPIVAALVRSHLNNPYDPCLVLEGSAILPELAGGVDLDGVARVWMTADDGLIRQRISLTSALDQRDPQAQQLIEAFLARSLVFNARIAESTRQLGLEALDASHRTTAEARLSSVRARTRPDPNRPHSSGRPVHGTLTSRL
ncbi:MAG: hypothetical protein R3E86_12865 [Pseudomonadales bacterium]